MKNFLILLALSLITTAESVLIWVTGAPGAGKTSAVTKLKQKNPDWIYLSMDEYLESHDASPVQSNGELRPQNWLRFAYPMHLVQGVVDVILKAETVDNKKDEKIIIIDFALSPYYMPLIKQILSHIDMKIDYHVHLYCNDKVLLQRINGRDRDGPAKAKILYEYRHMSRFKKSSDIKMIDTGSINPDQVADQLEKYIYKQCYWLSPK